MTRTQDRGKEEEEKKEGKKKKITPPLPHTQSRHKKNKIKKPYPQHLFIYSFIHSQGRRGLRKRKKKKSYRTENKGNKRHGYKISRFRFPTTIRLEEGEGQAGTENKIQIIK